MALGRLWAGRAYGTNTGNLFVSLQGEDSALSGALRLNEPGVGLIVYSVAGTFDGARLTLTGEPQTEIEGVALGRLSAVATLNPKGELEGQWETDIGAAGTLALFPHDRPQAPDATEQTPDQLHTARHQFGAIEIDREQIIAIAEEIQREFTTGKVVVSFTAGTEQSRFVEDFKALNIATDRAETVKIFAQEPEHGGINRVVSIEFGPQLNVVQTQSASESWALGKLEALKRDLRHLERTYTTNFKRLGFGINDLLLLWALIYLPSLPALQERAIFMGAVLALIYAVNWLHKRYLPFAAIYLTKKPVGLLARISPSLVSWLIAVTAGTVVTVLSTYLQGWLNLPAVP